MAQQRIRPSKLPEILAQFGRSPEAEAIQSAIKGFTSGADLASTLAARKQEGRAKELQIEQLQSKIAAEKERQAALQKAQGLAQPVTPETPLTEAGFGPAGAPLTAGQVARPEQVRTAVEPTTLAGTGAEVAAGEQFALPGGPEGVSPELEEQRQSELQQSLITAFPEKFAEKQFAETFPDTSKDFEQQMSLLKFGLDKEKAASLDKFKNESLKLRKQLADSRTAEARQRTLTQIDNSLLRAEKEFGKASGIKGFFENLFGGVPGLEGGQEVLESLKGRREILGGAPKTSGKSFTSATEAIAAKNRGELKSGDVVIVNGEEIEVD
jgi:hypothetical protein